MGGLEPARRGRRRGGGLKRRQVVQDQPGLTEAQRGLWERQGTVDVQALAMVIFRTLFAVKPWLLWVKAAVRKAGTAKVKV